MCACHKEQMQWERNTYKVHLLNAHKMCTVGKEFRLKGLRVQFRHEALQVYRAFKHVIGPLVLHVYVGCNGLNRDAIAIIILGTKN